MLSDTFRRDSHISSQWLKNTFSNDDFASNVKNTTDSVRWLIDQQSFDGAWLLDEKDIQKLTNGKSLSTFESTITQRKYVLTTALVITFLQLKYPDQKNFWHGIVNKGRFRI